MSEAVTDPTRLTARKWYLMAGAWSLLLVQWVLVAATSDRPLPVRVLLVLVVLAYAACYVHGLVLAMWRYGPRFAIGLVVVMTALWLVIVLAIDGGSSSLSIASFVVVAIVALLPPRAG